MKTTNSEETRQNRKSTIHYYFNLNTMSKKQFPALFHALPPPPNRPLLNGDNRVHQRDAWK